MHCEAKKPVLMFSKRIGRKTQHFYLYANSGSKSCYTVAQPPKQFRDTSISRVWTPIKKLVDEKARQKYGWMQACR